MKIRRINELRSNPRGGSQSGSIEKLGFELFKCCCCCRHHDIEVWWNNFTKLARGSKYKKEHEILQTSIRKKKNRQLFPISNLGGYAKRNAWYQDTSSADRTNVTSMQPDIDRNYEPKKIHTELWRIINEPRHSFSSMFCMICCRGVAFRLSFVYLCLRRSMGTAPCDARSRRNRLNLVMQRCCLCKSSYMRKRYRASPVIFDPLMTRGTECSWDLEIDLRFLAIRQSCRPRCTLGRWSRYSLWWALGEDTISRISRPLRSPCAGQPQLLQSDINRFLLP